jgi:GNAT superfamily N-acetyltransferase
LFPIRAHAHFGKQGHFKLRYPSHYTHLSSARDPLELGQLYALPTHTGQGIGARLMDWALGVARERGHDAVLVF